MSDFIKVKATGKSLLQRKLSHGVGVNDAWYTLTQKVNGKTITCPAYSKWSGVIARSHSKDFQRKYPTYIKCSVSNEWLTFSNFAKWFDDNNVKGYALDKDLKFKGNKTYSAETCLFVPQSINNLITDRKDSRGEFPKGVSFNSKNSTYIASLSVDGKTIYIGSYETPELAGNAHIKAKNSEIIRKSEQYPEFAKYLINHLTEEAS